MKSWLLNAIMGGVLLVGGAWMTVYLLQHPPIQKGLAYCFIGVALLGALLINPTPILSTVKQVVVVILPIIPWAAKRTSTSVPVVPPSDDKG